MTYSNSSVVGEGAEGEAFSGMLNVLDGPHAGGLSGIVSRQFFRVEFESSLSGAVRIGDSGDENEEDDELGLKTLFTFTLQQARPLS